MLHARKQALENTLRQRLIAIRERELLYYTDNCRNIGNQAALISGLAYSGIRYHYLLERNTNYVESVENSFEECLFLSLLSVTLGCALQTVFTSMLVALFGPQLALRGPDGSLHDAVNGMHRWNSVIIALFMTSLILLQLSAFSLLYGHSQLTISCRVTLLCVISLSVLACLHYARLIMRRLSLPKEVCCKGLPLLFSPPRFAPKVSIPPPCALQSRVSGAFFANADDDLLLGSTGTEHTPFDSEISHNGCTRHTSESERKQASIWLTLSVVGCLGSRCAQCPHHGHLRDLQLRPRELQAMKLSLSLRK